MQTHVITTPFGRRPMTLGQMASQATARTMPKGAVINKWNTFHFIREAKELIGATDRSLAILNALLSFHRETELSADGDLIVWPSNVQLAARANGMSPATLRRHLAVLVDCGLIIRRDSPNGKRFARKSRSGEIEQAYGFDLTPIVARAEEFEHLAETVQAEKKAYKVAKERLTLLRRDIVKMIEAGIEEGVPGNWGRINQHYSTIMSKLPRTAARELVDSICEELQDLWVEVHEALETFINSQNMNANESHSDAHIQNSNPDSFFETEHGSGEKEEASGTIDEADNVHSLPKRELPLSLVLDACPDMRELGDGGKIRHWRDFVTAAELARVSLGISPSAWREACEAMGELPAAITLAGILQRADQISSAGGYLRSLTDKAREGKFSPWPMIMALVRVKLDQNKSNPVKSEHNDVDETAGLRVSDALIRSLQRPKP